MKDEVMRATWRKSTSRHPVSIMLLLFLFAVLLVFPNLAPRAVQAQDAAAICFPDVPAVVHCVHPALTDYWRSNGGLAVFGYPLGPLQSLQAPDTQLPIQAQWFERTRLELQPANPPDYRIQLGRMGAERLLQLGRDPFAEGREPGPIDGCLWFAETGHNVCDQGDAVGFRSYWEANGLQLTGLSAYERSLALFGLPLTAAQPEVGSDGELRITQWFERARFEWHPDNPADYRVLLGLLGDATSADSNLRSVTTGLPFFGAEISRGLVGATYGRVRDLSPVWVRYNGLEWHAVETQRGERDWSRIAGLETDLAAITEQGGQVALIVRGAPTWAQLVPGKACGPIKPEALADYADFLTELVSRYSVAPYNVKYWEIGNEPDVDPVLVPGNYPLGCHGDANDPYYGGERYAELLRVAYTAIKAVDPQAQVIMGGLLLDCDPASATETEPCAPGRFLEGVLRGGGGDYFDILAFHGGTPWWEPRLDWERNSPKWKHRDGFMAGKYAFVRETLAWYGYVKPVILNETQMLCFPGDPNCPSPDFYPDQANHLVRLYTRGKALGLAGISWYTLNGPGWRNGGLLNPDQSLRPSFTTLQFLADRLEGAVLVVDESQGALESYTFERGCGKINTVSHFIVGD
jgi:hypothetical protein